MFKSIVCAVVCLFTAALISFACASGTVEGPQRCVSCGMDRTMFAQSRMVVSYSDGSSAATCSIHCAVEAIRKSGAKKVAALKVADYRSKELIDAKSAIWVVGGKPSGVMTSPAKWAFASSEGAQQFIKENGGSIASFEQVVQAVQQEVEEMERVPEPE